jgi:hypothetical protein
VFARGICGRGNVGRRRHDAEHGCYVDDGAAVRAVRIRARRLSEHLPNLSALACPDSRGIHSEDVLELGEGDFGGRRDGAAYTGVVDGIVEAAELLHCLRDTVGYGRFVGYVEGEFEDRGVWGELLELGGGGGEGIAVDEGECADALTREGICGVLTDAFAG